MGKLFFNILGAFAEFEINLLRMRTREGMAVAHATIYRAIKRHRSQP